MVDIYWIVQKKKQGPITVAEAISRVQAGDLDEHVQAWHNGCSDWMPLRELPAMQEFFALPQASPTAVEQDCSMADHDGDLTSSASAVEASPYADATSPISEFQKQISSAKMTQLYLPSASQRFFARMVDYSFYMMLYFTFIYILSINFSMALMPSNPLIWLPTVAIEACLIYRFRTTLGKKLMGVYIFSLNPAERLSFIRSLKRSFLVFFIGMGMMLFSFPIPLIMIAMGLSYWKLRKRGISMWDLRAISLPLQKAPPRIGSYMLAVLFITVNLHLVSMCFERSWSVSFDQYIEKHMDELYHILPSSIYDRIAPELEEGVKQH